MIEGISMPDHGIGSIPTVRQRAGFTLIELLTVVGVVAVLIGLTLAAVQKVRRQAARAQCLNNLHQLGVAIHGYQAERSVLPPGICIQSGKPPMPYAGWQVYILPHIERQDLWRLAVSAYEADRWFLSPPHQIVREAEIRVYNCPLDYRLAAGARPNRITLGLTSYVGVEGTDQYAKDGTLYADSRVGPADIRDGLSTTILVAERPPSADLRFGWWYAGWGQGKEGSAEMVLGAREAATGLTLTTCPVSASHFHAGSLTAQCDALHFWSPHDGGAHFLFADGSVRFLTYSADAILPSLATRAGGESVELP